MTWVVGVNIPDNKKITVALTYIFGIGPTRSKEILKITGIDVNIRAKDLKLEDINKIKEIVEKNYKIEGYLRRELLMNIRRLQHIGSWRGVRHSRHMPVRGQRTKTNSRTVRGNTRRTVGSGRKSAPNPT